MPRYLITGGRQRRSRFIRPDEWHAFETAVLIELDTDTGATRTVLEYQTPAHHCPAENPSFVFKAGSWDGEHLLLCTQTDVVVYHPGQQRVIRTISHPWFNDVHHVARIDGRLHVVSTGLDAVLVLDDDDQVVELHSGVPGGPWNRHSPDTDYRRVSTTKPHGAHPNYVFKAAGARWMTRFEQRDAIRIDGPGPAIHIGQDPIHDGVLAQDSLWFTMVSGTLVEADPVSGVVRSRHDLAAIDAEPGRPLGWCRGLHIEADHHLVAFTRIRPTRLKQNLSWLRKPLNKPEVGPSRVVAYDLRAGTRLRSWNVEDTGISAIFSILPATPPA